MMRVLFFCFAALKHLSFYVFSYYRCCGGIVAPLPYNPDFTPFGERREWACPFPMLVYKRQYRHSGALKSVLYETQRTALHRFKSQAYQLSIIQSFT